MIGEAILKSRTSETLIRRAETGALSFATLHGLPVRSRIKKEKEPA